MPDAMVATDSGRSPRFTFTRRSLTFAPGNWMDPKDVSIHMVTAPLTLHWFDPARLYAKARWLVRTVDVLK